MFGVCGHVDVETTTKPVNSATTSHPELLFSLSFLLFFFLLLRIVGVCPLGKFHVSSYSAFLHADYILRLASLVLKTDCTGFGLHTRTLSSRRGRASLSPPIDHKYQVPCDPCPLEQVPGPELSLCVIQVASVW